jgi:hypothetical protein
MCSRKICRLSPYKSCLVMSGMIGEMRRLKVVFVVKAMS